MIHNCLIRSISSRRKSPNLSIPEKKKKKKWHSAILGPRVHYFSGMDRYKDFPLYLRVYYPTCLVLSVLIMVYRMVWT